MRYCVQYCLFDSFFVALRSFLAQTNDPHERLALVQSVHASLQGHIAEELFARTCRCKKRFASTPVKGRGAKAAKAAAVQALNYYAMLIQRELGVLGLTLVQQETQARGAKEEASAFEATPTILWVDDEPGNNEKVRIENTDWLMR